MSKKYTTTGTALIIGVDTANKSFRVYGRDAETDEVVDLSLKRDAFATFISQHPGSRIAMEACGGSQYWVRKFCVQGCKVELLPPWDCRLISRSSVRSKMNFNKVLLQFFPLHC